MPERLGTGAPKLAALHRDLRRRFSEASLETPDLDAWLLVEHCTGSGRIDLIRDPERLVTPEQAAAVQNAAARRLAGEPVHRIIGWREFYGLRLALSPETLEPRPDTETLVDLVLPHARRIADATGECRVLDLGTGTGAVALALVSAIPQARALGTDISEGALAMAFENAVANGLDDRFRTAVSDWFAGISEEFDVIVSNPPYITEGEMADLAREVSAFDPPRALYGGSDGLDAYRRIAAGAARHLHHGGAIAVEIGSGQKVDVATIFSRHGFVQSGAASDLGGRDRALLFTL